MMRRPFADYLSASLIKEGHEVETFLDGQEALNAFETKKFNMAIVDVNLGKAPDGIQVSQNLTLQR